MDWEEFKRIFAEVSPAYTELSPEMETLLYGVYMAVERAIDHANAIEIESRKVDALERIATAVEGLNNSGIMVHRSDL